MRTLKDKWKAFQDSARLSVSRTKCQVRYDYSQIADQLAMTLGICEAAAEHISVIRNSVGNLKIAECQFIDEIRFACVSPIAPERLEKLETCITEHFALSLILQSGSAASALLLYQQAALGWGGKAVLSTHRGDIPSANAAGINCMSAIQNVVVLTGHSIEDLAALIAELQG